ncbi:MAG: hypothetical protein AB7P20_02165 [Rhizobiaceae bacterium]
MNQIVFLDQTGARRPVKNIVMDWQDGVPCTVRELISERVRIEHDRFRMPDANAELDAFLYAPNIRHFTKMPAEQAVDLALSAFERNAYVLFVGRKQLTDLDDVVVIEPRTEVTFIKLMPLVGG